MDATPFLKEQHPISRRWATFDDNGVCGWLYLSAPDEDRIVADCWIYNRIPAPSVDEIKRNRGKPPPAARGYANSEVMVHAPRESDMRLVWSKDGEGVALLVCELPMGFIRPHEKRGVSRNLVKAGPWGAPWDQSAFEALFETGRKSDC